MRDDEKQILPNPIKTLKSRSQSPSNHNPRKIQTHQDLESGSPDRPPGKQSTTSWARSGNGRLPSHPWAGGHHWLPSQINSRGGFPATIGFPAKFTRGCDFPATCGFPASTYIQIFIYIYIYKYLCIYIYLKKNS